MKDFLYYNELFDLYGDLLTDHERDNFLEYYQEDLSLSEIAENKNVSRSAVSKTINTVIDKLNNYEDKLHMYQKKQTLINITKIDDLNKIKEEINKMLDN